MVYTNYESDHSENFTTFIGHSVNEAAKQPENLLILDKVPQEYKKYALFSMIPDIVINGWKQVWKSGINRSYQTDFEVYKNDTEITELSQVDLYIGIN